jgi:beta-lactamase superfamily II metal-dependent hydrolase
MGRSWIAAWALLVAGLAGCAPPPFVPLPYPAPPPAYEQQPTYRQPAAGNRSPTDLTLHFIDSGQGNCILIECPAGGLILDDCGSSKLTESPLALHLYLHRIIRQYTDTAPFLPRPLAVIATHPDRDHFDLIASARYRIDPDFVYRAIIAETPEAYPDYFRKWLNATPVINIFPPDSHGPLRALHCGLARVELLTINAAEAPGQPPPVSRSNADSAVIAIRYNNFLAILPGDAEGQTQDQVLRHYPGLRPTVLAASHHGSDTAGSNSLAWARALNPGIVIFSAAFENGFGHPRADSVENYLGQPGLLAYRPHHIEFYDAAKKLVPKTIDKAVFTTGYAGSIDITVDPAGALTLNCEKSANGGC